MSRNTMTAAFVAATLALSSAALAQDSSQPAQSQPAADGDCGHAMHGMMHGMDGDDGMMGAMPGMGMGMGMGSAKNRGGDEGPASMAYRGANMKMHRDMAITYTGNADVDFVKGMIPHHQGAIDMAKTVLAFGADPEVKKLAEDVIKAQTAEIAMMQAWLKKQGQ